MTKWFDTNYHYLVPEFEPGMNFSLASTAPVDAFVEARSLGIHTRPVLLGPVSFLLLGKSKAAGLGRWGCWTNWSPSMRRFWPGLPRRGPIGCRSTNRRWPWT